MKGYLLWGSLMLQLTVAAQSVNFNGSTQDGYDSRQLSATQQSESLFNGGLQDGSASFPLAATQIANSIFNGSIQDGYAATLLPATQFAVSIYNGTIQDGYAATHLPATQLAASIYNGTIQDGYAAMGMQASPYAATIFNGSIQDGYAKFPQDPRQPCGTPIDITQGQLSNIQPNSATFSWPTFNIGSSYMLYIRINSTAGTVVQSISDTSANGINSITIRNLSPSTYYCLTLQEFCTGGTQTAVSLSACFVTAPDPCPAPTNLSMLSNTSSAIRLGWSPGASSSSYQIMLIRQNSTDTFWRSGNISGSAMKDTFTCLPTGTFFRYYIQERCANNLFSNWVDGFSAYTSPGCQPPANLTSTVVNTQNAQLNWQSSYGNDTTRRYQISYGAGISSAAQGTRSTVLIPVVVNGNTRTHSLMIASGVGNISWYVREICGPCDTTPWIGPNTIATPSCTSPSISNMNVSAITSSSATLNWTSVNYNSSAVVELMNNSNSTVSAFYLNATASYTRTLPVSSLTAGTSYSWRVKEYCTNGDSSVFSSWLPFSTLSGTVATCSAPANQGIFVQSGQVLIGKWSSALYGNSSKTYQVSFGMNITQPNQGTLQGSGYYITQSPSFPTHFFAQGNAVGFTWYVRDICNPGDTSAWAGPFVMVSAKTDGLTGINTTNADLLNVEVFPNPNHERVVYIRCSAGNWEPVEVRDLNGKIVGQQPIYEGDNKLCLPTLPNGLYLLTLRSGSQYFNRTLILD
ncbi:MAG: T9SS type A sorting domain-containing protein [Chitinophagales bacterium]